MNLNNSLKEIKQYNNSKVVKSINNKNSSSTNDKENKNLLKNLKTKKNALEIKEIINEKKKIIDIDKRCRDCFVKEIKYYCRLCNKFICNSCVSKYHPNNNHILLELDYNNLNKTFSQYSGDLNNILVDSIKSLDALSYNQDEGIDINLWNSKYKEDINKLGRTAYDIKTEKHKIIKEPEKENITTEVDTSLIEKEYNKINKIKCDVNKDPFETFSEINNKEKEIYKLINNCKSFQTKEQIIKNRINDMFLDVEDEIDKIMFQLEEQVYTSKNK
jgi:hypothetical protein